MEIETYIGTGNHEKKHTVTCGMIKYQYSFCSTTQLMVLICLEIDLIII